MPRVVIFTANNARIVKCLDASPYQALPNAVIDPDFSAVKGIAPHFWKLVDGKIQPMSESERRTRLSDHAERGVVNIFDAPVQPRASKWPVYALYASIGAFVFGLGVLLGLYLTH